MKNVLLILILVLAVSCHKKVKKTGLGLDKEYFKAFLLRNHKSAEDYQKIIIIPGSGCTGCISEAETYFTKNYKDASRLYIFTGIGDIKILMMKFPDTVLNQPNILIDKNNDMVNNGFTSAYPSFASLSDDDENIELSNFSK